MTQPCATITDARLLAGYRIEVTFSNGVQGVVDLANRIVGRGGVFASLENLEFFRRVVVDPEFGTIIWPNGVDICPDLLYAWTTGQTVSFPESEAIVS